MKNLTIKHARCRKLGIGSLVIAMLGGAGDGICARGPLTRAWHITG